ncbi:MAG: hypothetical protein HY083_01350 [Gammaproteobacteria bacterium]|nr:hypothetical protein [Gammaproteobacteria bacterium]
MAWIIEKSGKEMRMTGPTLKSLLPAGLKKGLTPAEKTVLERTQKDEWADLRSHKEVNDKPENANKWGSTRNVRAELLCWLCTDPDVSKRIRAKGARIRGAKIVGVLDFEDAILPHPLALVGCAIPDGIILVDARTRSLSFAGSRTGRIFSDRLKTAGGVFLTDGFHAEGEVRLLGADIGGNLECTGATFSNPKGDALNADGLKTAGSVFLRDGFHAEGEVCLLGADIGGQLSCARATLKNPKGEALNADRLKTVGSVFLHNGFHAEGEVRLLGADIGGDFACTGATLKNPEGKALSADGLKTAGGVFLTEGFHAEGEVRLLGADIGGDFACTGATLKNSEGEALSADCLKTTGNVFLNKDFHAEGEVCLLGADIGGQLDCTGATFSNPKGDTLSAAGMQVNGALFWRDMKNRPQGTVNLMHTRVGQLVDDEKSWPNEKGFFLDGFEYKTFAGSAPQTAVERLRWLRLQPQRKGRFWPQPYEQLAKVFRDMGHESDARTVLIAKQDDLRKYGQLSWKARLWNRFLGETIGHGHRTWKVFYYIVLMIVLGWFLFIQADKRNVMQPSRELVYLNAEYIRTGELPDKYPRFQPLVYSIDTFFPFVDLHQEGYWLPNVSKPSDYWFKVYLWIHIGMGWVLSTFAVAALTGLIRKDRSNSFD